MTCEVNDIYPQFVEIYVNNQNQRCTNVIKKGERVGVGEKAVPENQKTGEEICDGPDTSYSHFPKSKSRPRGSPLKSKIVWPQTE